MSAIDSILARLDEREIARKISVPHDEARMAYSLRKNTVNDFQEFVRIISDYYSYHFTKYVSRGGSLPASEAEGRAKEIIEHKYKSKGSNIQGAFNDAHDGTNGGLRIILDLMAEQLKLEAVERYIRKVFDDQIDPTSWEEKVGIIKQFIFSCGRDLGSSIDKDHPERYAQNYNQLIRAYLRALQQATSMFRNH